MSENLNTETGKRPAFLTVICILSFVGIGLAIIGYVAALTLMGVAQAAISTATEGVAEGPSTAIIWIYIIGGFVSAIVQLIGVAKMWKLQKSGFLLYTIPSVLMVILGVLYGGFTFGVIFPIAFIVMYGLNLKHLK